MAESASAIRTAKPLMIALLASASALAVPQVAHAEAAPAAPATATTADPATPDIIVTARKVGESLQQVPVTVSVVDTRTLKDYHVEHIADVAERVPTLQVQVGGSGSGGSLTLRGVGSSNISAAFDSAVAFDFDGIQVSTMRMVQVGFFDSQQVEVLKGPQSLYFGKSASAGVLSVKSADPTRQWEFETRDSYEFQEHGYVVGGHISGPLSDTLGIRLAAQYSDSSHYITLDPTTPAVNKFRGLKDFVGRLTLKWEPTSDFTANLKLQYSTNRNNGALTQAAIDCGPNGKADGVWLFSGAVYYNPGYGCDSHSGKYYLPDTAPALAGSVPKPSGAVGFNGVPFGKTNMFFGRLRMDYSLSDTMKLTSTTGYLNLDAQDVDNYSDGGTGPAISPVANALGIPTAAFFAANFPALAATNAPGTGGGVGTSDPVNKLDQFSQELRLTSNFKGMINFMAGAYFEHRRFEFRTSQNAVNISLIAPDPITGYTFDWNKDQVTQTNAYSAFGSVIIKPAEHVELSGGIRYTKEDKSSDILIPYMHAILTSLGFAPSGFDSGAIKFKDSNWSPEVTLKYQPTPDLNIFASYKTGFKSGGIDNSALPSNQLLGFGSSDPAVRAATAAGIIFKSEQGKGGEIGFKAQLANRTVTLNGTAFYYQYNNLQVQNFNATTIQFQTFNAGKVRSEGFDLETKWRTPLPGLALTGNVTLLSTKYNGDFITPGPDGLAGTADDFNLNGRDFANAPHWSGNVAFDYNGSIGNGLKLGLGGNMTFTGDYITANSAPAGDSITVNGITSVGNYIQKGFATFDARVSVGAENGRWNLAVVGNNIANKIYTINSGGRPFLAPANPFGIATGDDRILNQNRGRLVYVEATVKF